MLRYVRLAREEEAEVEVEGEAVEVEVGELQLQEWLMMDRLTLGERRASRLIRHTHTLWRSPPIVSLHNEQCTC